MVGKWRGWQTKIPFACMESNPITRWHCTNGGRSIVHWWEIKQLVNWQCESGETQCNHNYLIDMVVCMPPQSMFCHCCPLRRWSLIRHLLCMATDWLHSIHWLVRSHNLPPMLIELVPLFPWNVSTTSTIIVQAHQLIRWSPYIYIYIRIRIYFYILVRCERSQHQQTTN